MSSGRCIEPVRTLRRADGVKRFVGTAEKGNDEGLHGCVIGSKEGLTGGLRGRELSEELEDIFRGQITKNTEMLIIVLTLWSYRRLKRLVIFHCNCQLIIKKAPRRVLFSF